MPTLPVRPAGPITPHLWFDGQAEEAAAFYCSLIELERGAGAA